MQEQRQQQTHAPASRVKRPLKVWEVAALSVGFMGPVMAMALNGIGVAGLVGKAVPFTFALAFVGTLLVGYGFVRLTKYFTHAGSVYGLVGQTMGAKAGFFGGFALLGTYVFFAACIYGAVGVFYEAWAAQLGGVFSDIPWWVVVLICAALVTLLNIRESLIVTRVLFVIGAIGILAMLVLAGVILVRVATGSGPVAEATLDFGALLPGDASLIAIFTASVFAFLSWAGFESGSSLGEETSNPKVVIPRALLAAIVIAGVLYTVIMLAQTIGYGTHADGVNAFAGAGSTLSELSEMYIGPWYALLIGFIALMVAFGALISSTTAASRLIYALARDGFGPHQLGLTNPKTGVPTAAVLFTMALSTAMVLALVIAGATAIDVYYWYATIAILCMVVAYGMTSVGAIRFAFKPGSGIPKWEVILPVLGLAYLVFVYAVQVIGQEPPYSYFPWMAGAWCLIGLVIILANPKLADRIGKRLTVEDLE